MIEERNAFVSELKEIKLECQRVQQQEIKLQALVKEEKESSQAQGKEVARLASELQLALASADEAKGELTQWQSKLKKEQQKRESERKKYETRMQEKDQEIWYHKTQVV